MASYRPEVQVSGEPGWHSNQLRFATREEAAESARDLYGRWMLCTAHRAADSTDEPNSTYVDGRLVPLPGYAGQ
jgi:hypothetical protein